MPKDTHKDKSDCDPDNHLAISQQSKRDNYPFSKLSMNPAKFTTNNLAIIINRLMNGFPLSIALSEANVSRQTFDQWIAKSRSGIKRYGNLSDLIEIAKGKGIAKLHKQLLILSESDGKLTLEILRAIDPNTYSDKRVISHLNSGTIKIEYVDIGDRDKDSQSDK